MKKLMTIFGAIMLLSGNYQSFGQIYIGTKSYESTPSFKFSENSGALNSISPLFVNSLRPVYVSIGKRDNSQGLIMVSMSSFDGKLKGGLMIYLDDGTIISCTNRGLFDNVNDETMGVWYLSANEINKMKNSDISHIRYTLWNGFENRSCTASNKYKNPFDRNDIFPKSTNTTYYIKNLFY